MSSHPIGPLSIFFFVSPPSFFASFARSFPVPCMCLSHRPPFRLWRPPSCSLSSRSPAFFSGFFFPCATYLRIREFIFSLFIERCSICGPLMQGSARREPKNSQEFCSGPFTAQPALSTFSPSISAIPLQCLFVTFSPPHYPVGYFLWNSCPHNLDKHTHRSIPLDSLSLCRRHEFQRVSWFFRFRSFPVVLTYLVFFFFDGFSFARQVLPSPFHFPHSTPPHHARPCLFLPHYQY